MYKTLIISSLVFLLLNQNLTAQADSVLKKYEGIANLFTKKLSKQLENKYSGLSKKMDNTNAKLVRRLQKQELKIRKKLSVLDSVKAKELFASTENYYSNINQKLKDKTSKLKGIKDYMPGLDSLSTATNFLAGASGKLKELSPQKPEKIQALKKIFAETQSSIQSASDVRKLLSERKKQLQEALKQYNLSSEFKKMNKEIYYYQEQLKEYKNLLQDKNKLEEKALQLVRDIPAFKIFMEQNSWLAKLFPMPSNYGTAAALEGLQTRVSIQNELTQRLVDVGGGNPQQYLNGQVQAAKKELDILKNKLNQAGGEDADMEMPNFNPNQQKTKLFWQRLEYGFNIQSQKSNQLLPSTSDFAAIVGYKLSDKSTIGLGGSYKIGWGNGLRNIRLSSQGIGLRSFSDVRIKGSFWITGGYELNYLPLLGAQLERLGIPNLSHPSWQASGLIGLTKKYTLGKKTHNLQLLWDFLSYRQIPRTEALKFRVGFKL